MKIVIAGSRKYNDYDEAREYIDLCIGEIGASDIVIISGGCTGADMLGERYAAEMGFEVERVEANWGRHGKAAGPLRNKIMAEKCDVAICFWDDKSTGTRSMIECAVKAGKKVFLKRIEPCE